MLEHSLVKEERAQGALEQLVLIGGVVLMVVVVSLAVKTYLFQAGQEQETIEALSERLDK